MICPESLDHQIINTRTPYRIKHPQYGIGSISPFSPAGVGPSASIFDSPTGQFLQPQFGDGGERVIRYLLKLTF